MLLLLEERLEVLLGEVNHVGLFILPGRLRRWWRGWFLGVCHELEYSSLLPSVSSVKGHSTVFEVLDCGETLDLEPFGDLLVLGAVHCSKLAGYAPGIHQWLFQDRDTYRSGTFKVLTWHQSINMATLFNRPGCHLGSSRDKMGFSPLAMAAPGRVEHNQHARLRFHEAVKGGDEICKLLTYYLSKLSSVR